MAKRKDECLFCGRRSCSTRIVRLEEPAYDEVACDIHVEDLEKHSDEVLGSHNGVMRCHISSSGRLKRGEPVPSME